jgi:hypothetical protein
MELQAFDFIILLLMQMNVAPTQIKEDAHLLFDLNLDITLTDAFFTTIEKQYQLNTPLTFSREVASLRGLANYIECSTAH